MGGELRFRRWKEQEQRRLIPGKVSLGFPFVLWNRRAWLTEAGEVPQSEEEEQDARKDTGSSGDPSALWFLLGGRRT